MKPTQRSTIPPSAANESCPEISATQTQNPALLLRQAQKERQARILLSKVDSLLKSEGIDSALNALMDVRLKAPLIPTTVKWINNYRDMLFAWHAGLMPEVIDEFRHYGFRRARAIVHRAICQISDERLNVYYLVCHQVLVDMAHRSSMAIADRQLNSNELGCEQSSD